MKFPIKGVGIEWFPTLKDESLLRCPDVAKPETEKPTKNRFLLQHSCSKPLLFQ
jgi:hypothetical protein